MIKLRSCVSLFSVLSCFLLFSCSTPKELSKNDSVIYKYSPNPKIDSLLSFAFKQMNKPYKRGASGPNKFDCSGFTSYVFNEFGYPLLRTSEGQTRNGKKVSKNKLQPGDLVFFKGRNSLSSRIGHVGIVLSINEDGSFTFIHAASSTGISHDKSTTDYYAKRYVSAHRVIESYQKAKPSKKIDIKKEGRHIVEEGDTLYSLSKKYDCSVDFIKEKNGLKSNTLKIGQELLIK